MRSSILSSLTLALPVLSFSPAIFPRAEEKTTLNDIDTLCTINFFSEPKAIICLKDGASTTFTTKTTTYLRNNDDAMCCEADNICMLSNHTVPRATCYDPKDKRAGIAQDGGPCEMNAAGDGCKWTGTNRGTSGVFSTKGVTKITAVRDGQAVLDGSSGFGSGGGSGKSGTTSVRAGLGGVVMLVGGAVAFLI